MMKPVNAVTIAEQDLLTQYVWAQSLIESVSGQSTAPQTPIGRGTYVPGSLRPGTAQEAVSLTGLVHGMQTGDALYTETELHVLRVLRRGVQVGLCVADRFRERSGVASFDSAAGLTADQTREFNEKMQTAAAIAQSVCVNFVRHGLMVQVQESAFAGNMTPAVEAPVLTTPKLGLQAFAFHLGKNLERMGQASDDQLVAMVDAYAERMQEELARRESSFRHVEFFTEMTYALEGTDFTVQGFQSVVVKHATEALVIVERDAVIGNREALDELETTLPKLFMYDPEMQVNPIFELGGFQSVVLFEGDPGNGKSLMGARARTLGFELAERMGLPYQDIVVPNMVSKMQGESTDLANAIIARMRDPRFVNLVIGDEWEVVMPDHGDEDSSEGDKKVAVAWLKGLSGVATRDIGNFLLLTMSNYPGRIDAAFLSRIKSRHRVNGAETLDEFVRFIVLNLRKFNALYPGLVNLENVDWNMDLRAPQVTDHTDIRVDPGMTVEDIRRIVAGRYDVHDLHFLATFFWMMKQRQPRFSLRDGFNTIDSAKARVSSFRIPDELLDDPSTYRDLPLEGKRGVLKELAISHIAAGGFDFAQILVDRAVYYAEGSLRILDEERNRAIDEMVERGVRGALAQRELDKKLTQMGFGK